MLPSLAWMLAAMAVTAGPPQNIGSEPPGNAECECRPCDEQPPRFFRTRYQTPGDPWKNAPAETSRLPSPVVEAPPGATNVEWQGSGTPKDPSSASSNGFPSLPGLKGVRGLTGVLGNLIQTTPNLGGARYPSQPVPDQDAKLGFTREFFQFSAPVFHHDADTVVLASHVQQTNISTSAILPDSHQAFPSQLTTIWVGANYFHAYDNGTVGGVMLDVGTASDMPFKNSGDLYAAGTAFLFVPQGQRNAWLLAVTDSTNSQILHNIPIPFASYIYNPSDDFQAMIGVPMAINYRVHPHVQLQFLYMLLTTVHARAVYQRTNDWQLYAGFDWANENYDLSNRQSAQDRFYYYEKRLSVGGIWWWSKHVGLEATTGYAYDRYFVESQGLLSLGGSDRVVVGNGVFATLQLNVRF